MRVTDAEFAQTVTTHYLPFHPLTSHPELSLVVAAFFLAMVLVALPVLISHK